MNYPTREIYRPLLALLLLLISLQSGAYDVQPFSAEYHLYRGDNHIGNTQIRLQNDDGTWIWYTETRPVGFYRLFTKKTPFAETRMRPAANRLKISQQRVGDHPQQAAEEKTWFDQQRGLIFYNKKKKSRQLKMPDEVYDYLSIHLLHRQMAEAGLSEQDIVFYKNGKLVDSHARLDRQLELIQHGSKLKVDRLTQSFAGSGKKMIYYYQQDSLAPLKVEQLDPDKPNNVMWRISINRQPAS